MATEQAIHCPYCSVDIVRKKAPSRRSSFACKACGKTINVEPGNWLYDTPYLNDRQSGYVGFLWQLDRWVFTKGSQADYLRVQASLRPVLGRDPEIGEVIWGLMVESMRDLEQKHKAELARTRRLFEGRVPRELRDTGAKTFIGDLKGLMREFRSFDRKAVAQMESAARSPVEPEQASMPTTNAQSNGLIARLMQMFRRG